MSYIKDGTIEKELLGLIIWVWIHLVEFHFGFISATLKVGNFVQISAPLRAWHLRFGDGDNTALFPAFLYFLLIFFKRMFCF